MEFETKNVPGSPDHVAEFLGNLSDRAEEEQTTAYKILTKFEEWQQLTFLELTRAEHIKHIEDNLFEARVRVRRDCYRFLGYTGHDIFFMVHAIKKQQQKLARKDISLAKDRIKMIKENENR